MLARTVHRREGRDERHDLRHQELRHDEEGARLARQGGHAYAFHDYKTAGIERARLEGWAGKVGWETLLNRSGTTFRKLPDADKSGLTAEKAIALMLAQPSMIKRPVLELAWRQAARRLQAGGVRVKFVTMDQPIKAQS